MISLKRNSEWTPRRSWPEYTVIYTVYGNHLKHLTLLFFINGEFDEMLDELRIDEREHPILLKLRSVKSCKIIRRINRFVVEVIVDDRRDFAHINNTGRLQEYLIKGKEGFCLKFEKPKKTKYRLFSIAVNEYAALIDTWIQSKAFEKAFRPRTNTLATRIQDNQEKCETE